MLLEQHFIVLDFRVDVKLSEITLPPWYVNYEFFIRIVKLLLFILVRTRQQHRSHNQIKSQDKIKFLTLWNSFNMCLKLKLTTLILIDCFSFDVWTIRNLFII